jgi:hypothetical protein
MAIVSEPLTTLIALNRLVLVRGRVISFVRRGSSPASARLQAKMMPWPACYLIRYR